MKWWNSGYLYMTDRCVQTMHTRKNRPPDLRQKCCPLPYIRCWTTDRQTSDPQRFFDL